MERPGKDESITLNAPELPRSLTDIMADWLLQQMTEGNIKPGQQLNIDDMARQFGVSQTPIREALRSLQAEGLVEYPFRRSPRVAPLTRKTVQDIYVCRAHLMGLVARLATTNMDTHRLAVLEAQVDAMEEAVADGDVQGYFALSSAFNDTIVEIADNQVLSDLLKGLRRRSLYLRYRSITKPTRVVAGLEFHRKTIDAFRLRDAELAQRLFVGQILGALKVLVEEELKDLGVRDLAEDEEAPE